MRVRGRERNRRFRVWYVQRILIDRRRSESEFWAHGWNGGCGPHTNNGFVDLVSAQLDDFMRVPTERWYCGGGGCHALKTCGTVVVVAGVVEGGDESVS